MPRARTLPTVEVERTCELHGVQMFRRYKHNVRKDGSVGYKDRCPVCHNERMRAYADRKRREAKIDTRPGRRMPPARLVPGATRPASQTLPEL